MKYDSETERRVQIRAEMTNLLYEVSRDNNSKTEQPSSPEDAQTYGVLIIMMSASLVILFGPSSNYQLLSVLGLFGAVLGGFLIMARVYKLATKLKIACELVFSYAVRLERLMRRS